MILFQNKQRKSTYASRAFVEMAAQDEKRDILNGTDPLHSWKLRWRHGPEHCNARVKSVVDRECDGPRQRVGGTSIGLICDRTQ